MNEFVHSGSYLHRDVGWNINFCFHQRHSVLHTADTHRHTTHLYVFEWHDRNRKTVVKDPISAQRTDTWIFVEFYLQKVHLDDVKWRQNHSQGSPCIQDEQVMAYGSKFGVNLKRFGCSLLHTIMLVWNSKAKYVPIIQEQLQ